MAAALNRRLSTTDASFLYIEKPNQPMHIGSCGVYEGHLTRASVIETLRARIDRLPRYRQRAVFPPFGIAHPTWEDDPEFDVAHHVEEATLPAPGDDQALSAFGGALFGQVLDRQRPLWKLILLHGRADGNTAMLALVHHAMVDGVSGVDLQLVLHDLTPTVEPPVASAAAWQPQPMPDPLTLLQDAVRDRLTETARIWTDEYFRWWRPAETRRRAERLSAATATSLPNLLTPAPRTPFNGPISTRRQFAWLELPFSEVRAIRANMGGMVNDVVLAVLGGGIGRYLAGHGVRTEGLELRAMCPVSMRRPDERGALGNLVSIMIAPVFCSISDPLQRLAAVRAAMERLKAQDQAGGLYALTELADLTPPPVQAFTLGFPMPNTLLNTVSTNVPGPQIPLYLAGRMLRDWYPLGPLATGIGLFNAILSYNQKLTIGATVDPERVPDPWHYIDCLNASFIELRDAAGASAPATGERAPAAASSVAGATRLKRPARPAAART